MRGRRAGWRGEDTSVEHEEEEEQSGDDQQLRGVGRMEEAVDDAGEVVEDSAEVDDILGDARRARVSSVGASARGR